MEDIQKHALDKLMHPSKSNNAALRQRHLFLLGADWGQQNPILNRLFQTPSSPMTLSLGPVPPSSSSYYHYNSSVSTHLNDELQNRVPFQVNPHLSVPYANRFPKYQPYPISTAVYMKNDSYWEDRPFAMGAAFGQKRALPDRKYFLKHHTEFIGSEMGGKPHSIHSLGASRDSSKVDFMALYRNSTFCLIVSVSPFILHYHS